MIRCGDFGGLTLEGKPCGALAGSGTPRKGYGPCKQHLQLQLAKALPPTDDPQKRAFLAAYCITANISRAALASGIYRSTHYTWLESDPQYAIAFGAAMEIAGDELESEARRRAMYGVEEPVYQGGKKVGTIAKYSDMLMVQLLKGAKPEKYRERTELTGKDGAPLIPPTQFSSMSVTELVAIRMKALTATVAEEG